MPAKLRILNARTPEQWVELIQSQWRDSVKGIMDVGLSLFNAREELSSAEFRTVKEKLGFADSTATQLIKIGTDPKLMEVDISTLPAGWGTLYGLARLSDEQFRRGLDSSVIHAGMQQKDVAKLKPPKEPRARKAPAAGAPPTEPKPAPEPIDIFHPIETHAAKLRDFVLSTMADRPFAEWGQLIARFRDELDDIEGDIGDHETRMRELGKTE